MIERQKADTWMDELGLEGMTETVSRLCEDRNLSISEFYKLNRAFIDGESAFGRPNRCSRNMGKRPYERIFEYLADMKCKNTRL